MSTIGALDFEDILAFQVALGPSNPSFLYNIQASLPIAATGAGYAPAPNSVIPATYSTGGSPVPFAGWAWSGFDNSPVQTAILTVFFQPGAIGTIPVPSRLAQMTIYMSAWGPQTFPISLVAVPEPSTAACELVVAGLFAGLFPARSRGRSR